MADARSIVEVFSGEFFHQVCCDCSLTHRVDVLIIGRSLVRLRFFVDEEKTAEMKKLYSSESSNQQES